jgi:hypothetical protein
MELQRANLLAGEGLQENLKPAAAAEVAAGRMIFSGLVFENLG